MHVFAIQVIMLLANLTGKAAMVFADIDCATSDGPIPPICENSADGEDPLRGADVTAESCRTSCAEAALAAGADRACELNLGFNPQLGELDPAGNSCFERPVSGQQSAHTR